MNLQNINMDQLTTEVIKWGVSTGLKIVLVLALMFAAIVAIRWLIRHPFKMMLRNKDIEMQKRVDTFISILRLISTILIMGIAGIEIMALLGINIGPLLATAGVAGVAIGFGAQSLVQDVISGFFILLEDQVRVGDVVKIASTSGVVEKVTLRTVVLRDLAGNVHFVRNGLIDVVTNMTKEYSRYVFDIGVAYREDTDEVTRVIRAVDEGMRSDPQFRDMILEPIEILGVDQFADSAVIIKARTKTIPIQQWAVAREFNRRLKKAFDEHGIEIPFPHVTLYPGREKDGSAPPLHLEVTRRDAISAGESSPEPR